MRKRVGMHPTTGLLRCYRCVRLGQDPKLTVEPRVVKQLREGRYRACANVSCSNGHSWSSVHPEAVRQAREANASETPGGSED